MNYDGLDWSGHSFACNLMFISIQMQLPAAYVIILQGSFCDRFTQLQMGKARQK